MLDGLKKKIGATLATRVLVGAWKDGIAGKKGSFVKNALQKLSGLRSAILLLFVLVELAAKQFGFEAGPLFTVLRGLFAGIGWDEASAVKEIGIDPALLLTSIVGIYTAVQRFRSWLKSKRDAKAAADAAVVKAAAERT